jgi:phosphatidylglycerophosphate synthase
VLPPAAGCEGVALGGIDVAGLSLDRRIALAAQRAGFTATVAARDVAGRGAGGPQRIVALGGHVVPTPAWLRALVTMPLEPETLYVDGGTVAMIQTEHPGRVLDLVRDCADPEALAGALDGAVQVVHESLDPSGRFALGSRADVPAAEAWLLQSLIKPSEGFMSRHVERRISLAVTRRLAGTRVTPNAMTVVSVGIGLVGAPFFLAWDGAHQLIGALLFLTHSILDGCDGELARLKFQESRAGAMFDFWGDNFVHVAVFSCMAIGWTLATGSAWPLLLGAVTIVTALATATLAARRFIGGGAADAESAAARLAEALSHRDFIYLIVVLAAFGKASWFLVPAAVGTPSFLVLLLLLGDGGRRAARRP